MLYYTIMMLYMLKPTCVLKAMLQSAFSFILVFITASLAYDLKSMLHSKKICPMLHQKEALICWLQKFVLYVVPSFGAFIGTFFYFLVQLTINYGASEDEF